MRALKGCALIDPYVDVLPQVRHVGGVRADALEVAGERRLVGKDLVRKPLVQLALHRLVTLRPGCTGAKASDDYSGGVQDSHGAIVYIGLGTPPPAPPQRGGVERARAIEEGSRLFQKPTPPRPDDVLKRKCG